MITRCMLSPAILERFKRCIPSPPTASLEFFLSALIAHAPSLDESRRKACIRIAIRMHWEPVLGPEALSCVNDGIQSLTHRTMYEFRRIVKERRCVSEMVSWINVVVREAILVELLSDALVRSVGSLDSELSQRVKYWLLKSWCGHGTTEEVVVRSAIYAQRVWRFCRKRDWPLHRILFVALMLGSKMTHDDYISMSEWGTMYERMMNETRKTSLRYMRWELELCDQGLGWELHVEDQAYLAVRAELLRLLTVTTVVKV